jgi:hypothetical protein
VAILSPEQRENVAHPFLKRLADLYKKLRVEFSLRNAELGIDGAFVERNLAVVKQGEAFEMSVRALCLYPREVGDQISENGTRALPVNMFRERPDIS